MDEAESLFSEIEIDGIDFRHQENEYNDYEKEILLPHKMSQFGPFLTVGDVNGDKLDDFFIGGASGQSGVLYIQQSTASLSFITAKEQPWSKDKISEDMGVLFFDVDNDNDLDLYVVSGGNEFDQESMFLQDRLYENDGQGNFTKSKGKIPVITASGSCVIAGDYDNDGDMDLFVGGRLLPGQYPFPARSYLLNNNGNGVFTDVTETVAPHLVDAGMVTSAIFTDHNKDGNLDLIVVGEWMPLTIMQNENGVFNDKTIEYGLDRYFGWWNKIVQADFDNDGDMDYVAGNLGWNYKYHASYEEPLHVYCYDFDKSGSYDIVLGYYNDGECYPVRGRQCSSQQMPGIKDKFPNYDAFGKATITDVYGEDLELALHRQANYFSSAYIENTLKGFKVSALPVEAQFSTVNGIIADDLDNDGLTDILLAGNLYVSEVETGRADAGIGLFLKGEGEGKFKARPVTESGFFADLDAKDLALIRSMDEFIIIVANNNDKIQLFKTKAGSVNEKIALK